MDPRLTRAPTQQDILVQRCSDVARCSKMYLDPRYFGDLGSQLMTPAKREGFGEEEMEGGGPQGKYLVMTIR